MAKTNKAEIMSLCKKINSKEGKGSIYSLGNDKGLRLPRWSSGLEDLDNIIGGGVPEGRIIEIFGPEASGKTSLGYHLMSLHEMALDIPIEGTFDAERAKIFGNRPKQMIVYRARYGEQALNKAVQFAQAGIPLIVIDSVPACKPREDIEKLMKMAKTETENQERIGGVARLMHRYLPLLEEICENTGTTLILINQVRDKMDAMLFGEKTDTPGGRAPKFYSSIRMQVARRAWIEIPNKDVSNSAANKKVGMIMKVKVIKSKVSNPMGECELPMFFDRGFVSFDDVSNIRKELMAKQRGNFKNKYNEDEEE